MTADHRPSARTIPLDLGAPRPITARAAGGGCQRALFVSSPIGLGHVHRDLAIVRELRAIVPGLKIEWLAQDPVTRVLKREGETIHPASRSLVSEAAYWTAEAVGHELNCFEAFRHMDEILLANFMVFHDVVSETEYDLWIADEGWEVDHFLHEHPSLKTAPFVWMTDFVGHLPLAEGGPREAELTADYNAEMVEHIDVHPSVRDRSIFIGDPDDAVQAPLGPGLPMLREWTEEHFAFAGYVCRFPAVTAEGRSALRAELGYGDDHHVCLVTVGGSGVGKELLQRCVAALPHARRRDPRLRMVAVTGPRIDPALVGSQEGLEVRAFVPDLQRHLAACDVAIIQGGLATAMELTANQRPFIYVPLERHYEQLIHVDHRLRRHRAGRCVRFADAEPEPLAEAIVGELQTPTDYLPIDSSAARRAASLIAELL
jgi:predicted glycosyltransferase